MQNVTIIGIYAPFCIVTAVIFCIELFRPYKRAEDYLFMLLCSYALGWYGVNILGLLTHTVNVARFCVNYMLIFVSLIPPTLLLFILNFYKIKIPVKLPSYWPSFLYIIPAITYIMVLTANAHTLLNKVLEFPSLYPVREMVIQWGPWFWVHTAYSYILSFIIIILVLSQHMRVARFYRLPSTMMVLGVSITLAGNVVTLFQVVTPALELTLITMSLSLIFFSLAIFNNNNSKFVRFSRAHIYHYLADYILVVDEKNTIIDLNRAASAWFKECKIPPGPSLNNVMETLRRQGGIFKDAVEGENYDIDIVLPDDMFPIVLNRHIYQMKDGRGDNIGKIVVFRDVTENRKLIDQLETKAGMDSLTGLPNHMAYVGAKKRLDTEPLLPLSVIMCDVNKLKETNDTLGHEYGDMLLKTVSKTLEQNCPKNGFVARTGGDEFIYLLPETGLKEAEDFIGRLNEQLAGIKDMPFEISVSFGGAVKMRMEEDIDKIIALADSRMYERKKSSK